MFLKIVEYKSEEDKRQSMKGCFEKTKPLLQDMTNDLKKSGEWKMYLIMKPKFMSSKDSNEKCGMYCKSDSRHSYDW